MSEDKRRFPIWLTLALTCIIVAGILGITNLVTSGPIAAGLEEKAFSARQTAFPKADRFVELEVPEGAPVDECFEAYEKDDLSGYVVKITVSGCKGPIEIQAGYDLDGKITSFTCGSSKFQETAGLGAKVKDEAFRSQFSGKAVPLSYSDDDIDAITGATISSRAVLGGLNTAGEYIEGLSGPSAQF